MAKWFGKIGFIETVEVEPGRYKSIPVERKYYGDVTRNISRWTNATDSTNSNIDINNQISIVADPYANQNFQSMRYIEFMGSMWEISSKEVQRPRIILTIGGVYNGKQATTAE